MTSIHVTCTQWWNQDSKDKTDQKENTMLQNQDEKTHWNHYLQTKHYVKISQHWLRHSVYRPKTSDIISKP